MAQTSAAVWAAVWASVFEKKFSMSKFWWNFLNNFEDFFVNFDFWRKNCKNEFCVFHCLAPLSHRFLFLETLNWDLNWDLVFWPNLDFRIRFLYTFFYIFFTILFIIPIIWKKLSPGRYPVQKICPPKKWRLFWDSILRRYGAKNDSKFKFFGPLGEKCTKCSILPKISEFFFEILPDTSFCTDFYCNFKHDSSRIWYKRSNRYM